MMSVVLALGLFANILVGWAAYREGEAKGRWHAQEQKDEVIFNLQRELLQETSKST